MSIRGPFSIFAALAALPTLVRKQRRLEARIAALAADVAAEKAVRRDIARLLMATGLAASEGVTCLGYDVVYNERAGQSRLNADRVVEQLVAAGVDRELVAQVLIDSTETGERSYFATVKPSKGAKVRAA